jgi:multidrug efflux pump subunit AcrB
VGHRLRDAEQLGDIIIGVAGDRAIRLRDVAEIRDGPAEPDQYVSFLPGGGGPQDFESAVTIALAKREGTNAATIAHDVMHRVEQLRGKVVSEDSPLAGGKRWWLRWPFR